MRVPRQDQLAGFIREIRLMSQDCQLIVATHSPILLALPGATILEIDEDGQVSHAEYDLARPVVLTRDFLAAPERFLRRLLAD